MRRNLIEEIAEEVRLTSQYLDKDALDPRVMQALDRVPRHELVPDQRYDADHCQGDGPQTVQAPG